MLLQDKITNNTKQITKYLIAGVWNTIFGIGLYSGVIFLFGENHYLLIAVLCNIIAITQSFFCYKIFVFKTKGCYLKEYFRIYLTYGMSITINLILLYILVDFCNTNAIAGNIISTCITTILSYFLHKNFTFKQKPL